ncbi:MAG: hypothetical protein JWM74_5359 [Myxococcaceae bacterium]|nr:hypothetical protein [Myxococcaceae bacterium]
MLRRNVVSYPSCLSVTALTAVVALVALAACGGSAPPAAPSAVVVPATSTAPSPSPALGVGGAPSGPRRGATEALKKAWPFEDPKVVVYADLDGLVHTALMTEVMKSVIGLAGILATPPQVKCIDDGIANVKEVAFGSDGEDSLVVFRIDPTKTKWVGACLAGALPETRTITLRGATEAWSAHGVAALTASGLVLSGPKQLVERSLRASESGGGSGASLVAVTLGEGEYVAWLARIFDNASPMKGSLAATDARFRIAGEADVPNDALAEQIANGLSPSALARMLPTTNTKAEEAAALVRLTNGFEVKRDGRHVAIAFELREPPPQQARDLGVAAALAVYGVRKYISNAKQSEARNVLGQLAKDTVADWEGERPGGKPRSARKLVSFGPVPKTVPKGTKYQSTDADWKPWYPLRFSMTAPQYFQYEIVAAKDGESAEIIARGDLNGDGKTSLFKLPIKVDRATNTLRVSPSIAETDPDE